MGVGSSGRSPSTRLIQQLHRRLYRSVAWYREAADAGRSLRTYRRSFGRLPNVWQPGSWNEWIQRRKLFDRDRRYALYADKYAVRDYVAQRAGRAVLPELHLSGTRADEFRLAGLPERFMLKASHGCKWFLPMVRREEADQAALRRVIAGWLRRNFAEISGEWPYRRITPRFLVEEWLGDADGSALWDYKFYCFGGRTAVIHIDAARFGEHQRVFFTRDWQFRPIILRGLGYSTELAQLKPPRHLAAMIELAETLAADHDFLRVDLYHHEQRGPVFGELTFFPGSGYIGFQPAEIDREFGRLWTEARRRR
jgi:hypothetical protein